jgi:hypothetical protein
MDQRKQGLFILTAILCAVGVYLVVRLYGENDESRVRKTVYKGVVAVERKDLPRLMSLVSDTYLDTYGNNKGSLLRIAANIFREHRDLKVDIGKLKIQVKKDAADCLIGFKLLFRKNTEDQLYYDSGEMTVHFVKDGLRWKAQSVEYTGSDQLLLLPAVA